jgi:hypothetical protein
MSCISSLQQKWGVQANVKQINMNILKIAKRSNEDFNLHLSEYTNWCMSMNSATDALTDINHYMGSLRPCWCVHIVML